MGLLSAYTGTSPAVTKLSKLKQRNKTKQATSEFDDDYDDDCNDDRDDD